LHLITLNDTRTHTQ